MGWIFSTRCNSRNRLDGKTVIVTGGNSGIGKETAKDLYKRGAKVILACRNLEKSNEAIENIKNSCSSETNLGELKVVQLNLCSFTSIRSCAKELLETEEKINLLINNAGVMAIPFSRTDDGFETQFGTNHLGHFLFTLLLLPKICNSTPARIINVSSVAHTWYSNIDLEDLNWEKRKYNAIKAYQESKLANILFTKELARKLKENGICGVTTYSLHPGVIRTELSRYFGTLVPGLTCIYNNLVGPFIKTAEQGAQTQIFCAVSDECANETGLYYAECKTTDSSAQSNNIEYSQKLWNLSLQFVGLKQEDYFNFTKPNAGMRQSLQPPMCKL